MLNVVRRGTWAICFADSREIVFIFGSQVLITDLTWCFFLHFFYFLLLFDDGYLLKKLDSKRTEFFSRKGESEFMPPTVKGKDVGIKLSKIKFNPMFGVNLVFNDPWITL
jgi:hypothetical protein